MEILEMLSGYLQDGESEKVLELTKIAIEKNIPAKDILEKGLIGGMNVIGERFKNREIFLPEVLLAAKAMSAGMEELKPVLIKSDVPYMGRIVIGTIHGDLHDIGKNLVGIMLKGAGFDVIDLGKDVPAEKFVETAIEKKADIIGMSALLTTTMPTMKKVVELLKEKTVSGKIKTIVGGAPLSEKVAKEYGADAYAYDAANAVERVRMLMSSY